MLRHFFAASSVLGSLLGSATASKFPTFKHIVTFGDSYTDEGRCESLTSSLSVIEAPARDSFKLRILITISFCSYLYTQWRTTLRITTLFHRQAGVLPSCVSINFPVTPV